MESVYAIIIIVLLIIILSMLLYQWVRINNETLRNKPCKRCQYNSCANN